jgi:hypothetical protein
LQIDIRDELSPGIVKKIVYSGAHASSFAQAERDLAELAEVKIGAKQVERTTHRIGGDLLAQSRQASDDYQALPLVEKDRSPILHPPSLAVIQMDGGRYQRRSDALHDDAIDDVCVEEEPPPAEKTKHWCEDKVGLLMTMSSTVHTQDPHPQIPEVFVAREAVEKLVTEVGHVALGAKPVAPADKESAPATDGESAPATGLADSNAGVAYEPPTPLVRTMVATSKSIRWFEKLLAQAAWARGFAKAVRQAFVADGASANWSVWQKYFSHYTPILDFIHALSYVYLAATINRAKEAAWQTYCRWIQLVWGGNVSAVIAELQQQQRELGEPQPDEPKTAPRRQLAKALGYLQNNQSRMHYDEYRKQGLPITSCHIESTIKQFNKRIKGTEKFWSAEGAEAILSLKAAYLSETGAMQTYWQNRYSTQTPSGATSLAL